ncbi:MAG: bifunctional phosphoribosylaminoimidazolecarboxamide formyltransferase/IMP cyclohydrolase [Alphaproteobacteria bacterium]|nr:bifunctional phosphoribosylaminoimidazolecarboxamide formyltransferase/IMP cyclohydrolase [Alphaproteobacteria bacterium]MBL6937336.1 bifunctional phosphoribosylaminoimidazolecarboxamide formyltransferase/IMP cyclohydrolase [Alphaproteobacteria bacterium]MBL7096102.1 bifunctional phosphoribosylaminoimidazolecarboxamide formyltransferase/IMP cyclohydrolase [Alphaproteobacteria bacterium]
MTHRKIRRAILSVYDKTGLVDFAKGLDRHGVMLISTGGSAKALRAAGLKVADISEITGFPEMMDGRVKTLHPKVHGGLLSLRDKSDHAAAMTDHGIDGIDLLVSNLYPFEATVAKGAGFEDTIEQIDIGGPAMTRSAAKNHEWVTVVTDPEDYAFVLGEMDANDGATSGALRRRLAQIAFSRTAAYDAAVSNWFADELAKGGDNAPPRYRSFAGTLRQPLRYGENPHQKAAFYVGGETRYGVATAEQVQGRELSYINLLDADAAFELVAEFKDQPAVAIIKHANPCGVAVGKTYRDAYLRALRCDPVSRFGGIIALNGTLDGETAEEIAKIVTDVIIVPHATDEAKAEITRRRNARLLIAGGLPNPYAFGWTVKSVAGGLLVQTRDDADASKLELKVVTKKHPTPQQLADLRFAFRVGKHTKSNTIIYAKDGATVGIGAGQMSRVDAARIAAIKARDAAKEAGLSEPLTVGSVASSDAFFPFPDGLLAVAEAGATAVIQPGGSINDKDVIAAANEAGIAMVFSGVRQFRH